MATKKVDETGKVDNSTDTELQILKNIEAAFYRNNPSSQRRNTEKSLKWFSQYVPRSFNAARTSQIMRDSSLYADKISPGDMYFFVYDALHKDTLPVWDRFPLIFPWDSWSKDGVQYFIGINLHYLPPKLRFAAMKSLLTLRNQKRYRPNTKLKISWQILKSLSTSKLFSHAVKMYRMDQVRSRFIKIPAVSWELAVFLPLARWEGDKAKAWSV